MEAVFKITDRKRDKTIVVACSNFDELVSESCQALNLDPNQIYKFVLDEDGAEFQGFKSMSTYVKAYPSKFMILPTNEVWESAVSPSINILQNNTTNTDFLRENEISSTPGGISRDSTPSSKNSTATGNYISPMVWEKITPLGFKNIQNNSVSQTMQLIRNLADYMMDIKAIEFKDATRVAKETVARFPRSFEHTTWKNDDETEIFSDGVDSLKTRIYERIKYIKPNSRKRKTFNYDVADCTSNKRKFFGPERYGKDQDLYGCVAFEPSLSENESNESQKEKKQLLISLFHGDEFDDDRVRKLLSETYPSQRVSINNREKYDLKLEDVLKDCWPHLQVTTYFLTHANTLLGKDVKKVWNSNIELKIPAIYDYFRSYISFYNGKKNSPLNVVKVAEHLKKASEAEDQLKSKKPKSLVFLPIIASHFKEQELFTLVDATTSDDSMREIKESSRPMLIVKGMSIYDETCSCAIVIEKNIVLESNSVLEAVLLLILTYYVFGYNYLENQSSSLEFIQRMLLDINPPEGNKRKTKNYPKTVCDPKAKKLIDNVVKFSGNTFN
ncbi:uncharacterized protein LOC122505143 isoform X2 [Leptopilina heterotoma]|nr:uncharacterized protein LOC122505143 isoform X2 [Leptopilina heterotoma]XP_043472547.1 uncharacterized protein LOC122505143 isoform X2 [Leptopilina heterotoma]